TASGNRWGGRPCHGQCPRQQQGPSALLGRTFPLRVDATFSRAYIYCSDDRAACCAVLRAANVAQNFQRGANAQTRDCAARYRFNSRDLFRMGGYRPVSCEIDAQMAPGMGAGFGGFRCSLFSDGWHSEFRIGHGLWLTLAKDMERGNCAVLSILANELWPMGPACADIDSPMWLARLESWLALG